MRLLKIIQIILFSNKPYRFIILANLLIISGLLIKRSYIETDRKFLEIRSIITTLVRSDNQSIYRIMNMIHSVLRYHPSASNNYSYPILIFHDQNFTSYMRQQILSCVLQSYPHATISFALVYFNTTIQTSKFSRPDKTIGYRLMCRFWIYDIFYHPAIVQGQYDYLMRMDDDSYFSAPISNDIFQHMYKYNLDYVYRASYRESTEVMDMILKRYFSDLYIKTNDCIYNNFFAIRLKWYYQTERIQNFIHHLLKDNLILYEYIGDGCVHYAMLKLNTKTKQEKLIEISYGHNHHIMPAFNHHWIFNSKINYIKEINESCGSYK